MNFTVPSSANTRCKFRATFTSFHDLVRTYILFTIERDSFDHPVITLTPLDIPASSVDLKTLTWSTRPHPAARAETIKLEAWFGTTVVTEPFACADGWIPVEIGCEGKGCSIEYQAMKGLGEFANSGLDK